MDKWCKHGVPQFICRQGCGGIEPSGQAELSSRTGPVNTDSDEQVKSADIIAVEEVHDPREGLFEKTAGNSTSAMQLHPPTVLPSEHMEAGKGGEGGVFQVTNAEFIAAVFTDVPEGASVAVCSKPGNPASGGWVAHRADRVPRIAVPDHNNYLGCSSFYPGDDGSFKARKAQFAACHFLMLDDLGAKVPLDRLGDFELSWLIETSPGNYQGGIILNAPITDGAVAVRLLDAVIEAGLCDTGATGPLSRWARLPVAINGKTKYVDEAGAPFQCRLIEWRPDKRYSQQEIVDRLELELAPAGRPKKPVKRSASVMIADLPPGNDAYHVLIPKAEENPVVAELRARGLYKTPLGSGKHDMTCPWVHEHTDQLDTGAAYFEPDDSYPVGGFCCQHSHRDKYHIRELLTFLGVPVAEARHKPVIRVVPGDLHRVVDAAEKELAARGRHYQAGGLIVSVATDPASGDPSIVPTSAPALTRELSVAATWEKYDGRAGVWVRCDPPARHVGILFDAQHFRYLPPLKGVARQPYFRESDGELVRQPGYDKTSNLFGVFDERHFKIPAEPTIDEARVSVTLLEELLTEFHFVAPHDRAAALAAIFTAVVRPTLPHAPAFHVRAPVFGSGKTYLCELIGAFSGPGGNAKVSYPTSSEEATKVILSLLLTGPACVEFDDMDSDWIPHGTIKRVLTAETITDRILGVSKMATVSTRSLFLGSGNNVGPIRDLLRRVLTIHLDPRCATPALMTYKGAPVDKVRQHRGVYVAAVLAIILAWRRAGSPRAQADSIVTYGGAWSDYCRYPLMWLGYPDPATALFEQIRHDPDGDALRGLAQEWHTVFGEIPTTVRKAVEAANSYPNLLDAIREFPVEERGEINRSKLGRLLKKNADRIVGEFMFQKAEADGRTAWRVVLVKSPPLPPLPPSAVSVEKTGARWSTRF
jgi:hypothetical protein